MCYAERCFCLVVISVFVHVLGGSGVEKEASPQCVCCFWVIAMEPSEEVGVNSFFGKHISAGSFISFNPFLLLT